MRNLINTIEDLTTEKREYIKKHYMNQGNEFVGLFNDESEARKEACKRGASFKEIKIAHHCDIPSEIDIDKMSYLDKIKVSGQYGFYVCSIVRNTLENTLNGLYVYDDEINGATAIKN